MRESERQKLKALMDMGKTKEEILEAMKPRGNGNGHEAPEGGISLSAARRKYKIPQPTISRWVSRGYIPVLVRTNKELYIDEDAIARLAGVYHQNPGQGKRTIKENLLV